MVPSSQAPVLEGAEITNAAASIPSLLLQADRYKGHETAFYGYGSCAGFTWQMPPTVVNQGSC